MLSRVADSLYWMSRYLERAEHTARVLDVNLHGMIDQQPDVLDQRWARVLRGLRTGPLGDAGDEHAIAHALSFDAEIAASIVNSVSAARQNAREVREQISTDMWEQLNRLNLQVQNASRTQAWEGQEHAFFQTVKEGAYLFQGIADTTMSHEEGWHFIHLGRYLERVVATVNLLDAHFVDHRVDDPTGGDLFPEWVGLLKSCTAYEAYTRVHTANVLPEKVATFLLLDPSFPHAVRFGMGMVRSALESLAESAPALKQSGALRLVGKTVSALSFDPIEDIMAQGVHEYPPSSRRASRTPSNSR
ncbi:MAG: alpha-E domain-containing protein [Gemmatimonadota bacterium]